MLLNRAKAQQYGFRAAHMTVAATFTVLVFLAQFLFNSVTLDRLDGIGYDAKLTIIPPLPDSLANIQVVDIDERSLFEIERMPWRRSLYAELVEKLSENGAIVIAFDVLFSEPQANPASPVIKSLRQTHQQIQNDDDLVSKTLNEFDYDGKFADAMQGKEVVLGTLLHYQPDLKKGRLSEQSVYQARSDIPDQVTTFYGYAGVIERLADASVGLGFMNSVEDADGFVRRAALISKVDDILYPSLAIEAFRAYSLADKLEPQWQQQGENLFLEGIKIGTSVIPTDNQGRTLIPFKGPGKTYPYTSAADVLNGKITSAQFDQAVVFVGTSASGLADLRVTPVSVNFPGVEIHATIFESMLAPEKLIYRPDWWQGALALQLTLVALVIMLAFPLMGPLLMSISALVMVTLAVAINLFIWRHYSIDIPMVSTLILTLVLSTYFIASGFFTESRRRKQVKAVFDQYVPPAHIDELLDVTQDHSLEGEKKELSVMFSDIRSFTNISESMSAQDLKRWLNQFFSPITKTIFQNDGTIDKYVGDMVMAFWGAPLQDNQHANKSVRASFEMLNALEALNADFAKKNMPLANIGIGINTGEMNVGDMGSDYRRSYTVIGDAVNLGSRLEGLTKFYGLTILVSEFTKSQANDFSFLLIDKVKVKGKQKPVTIYSPIAPALPEAQSHLDTVYGTAISDYFDRRFESALQSFKSIKDDYRFPDLIALYIERSKQWIANPPPQDWDGSFTHTSK